MFVRNWMSAPAVAIPAIVTVNDALGFMERHNVRRLPVVDDGRLVGIVTRSDLMAAVGTGAKAREALKWSVERVMARKPVSVVQEDTLERAADLMLRKKISGLPVVDEDRVVGIITESDIFRAFCRMLGVGEKGARVTMSIKDNEDLLSVVKKRLGGLGIWSLATIHDPSAGRWDVVVRARGRTQAKSK